MNLEPYYFDVNEKPIALTGDINLPLQPIKGYKAIVAPDEKGEDQLISIVKDSYKLVRNRDLIEPFLEQVDSLGVNWHIGNSTPLQRLTECECRLRSPISIYRIMSSIFLFRSICIIAMI